MNPQTDEIVRILEDDFVKGVCWHHGHIDEDILTGHAFSALRYVPKAREEFLRHLCKLNKLPDETLKIGQEVRFEPWPGWEVPKGFRETFCQMEAKTKDGAEAKEKGGIEPDVVLLGEDWRLLVEAEESKDYDEVQLIQQYVLSRTSYQDKSRKTYQLLVGPTLGRPSKLNDDVQDEWKKHPEGLKRCEGDPDDLVEHLLWIGWKEIEGLFTDCAREVSWSEKLILLDTCEVLRAKGHAHVKSPRQSLKECECSEKGVQELVNKIRVADSFPASVFETIVQERTIVEGLTKSFRSSERLQLDSSPRRLALLQKLLETLQHTAG